MDLLAEAIRIGGLPFALVALALYGGMTGRWVWRRELIECEARSTAIQTRCDDYIRDVRHDFEDRLTAMSLAYEARIKVEHERAEQFSALLFEFLPRIDRATGQSERAVDALQEGHSRGRQ